MNGAVNDELPSIGQLENNVDYALRSQLAYYEDGRKWILVVDPALSLGTVGHAALRGDVALYQHWVALGQIAVFPNLTTIPGDGWDVLYFEDVYFLKARPDATDVVLL